MSDDVYKPPQADLKTADAGKGSSVRAVLFGVLIDIGGTTVYSFLLGVIFSVWMMMQGVSPDAVMEYFQSPPVWSPFSIVAMVGGTLLSFYAGRVCARISKTAIVRDVAILCVISATIGVVTGSGMYSVPALVAMTALTVVAIVSGAWSWQRKNS